MIICHCKGVTDREILKTIADGAATVKEVARGCGAGMYCRPCRAEVAQMLLQARAECSGTCGEPQRTAA